MFFQQKSEIAAREVAVQTRFSYGAPKYVGIILKDPENFIRSQPFVLRSALRSTAKAGLPVCVVLVGWSNAAEHLDYLKLYSHIAQRAIGSRILTLKEVQQMQQKLFVKSVYDQMGLDV